MTPHVFKKLCAAAIGVVFGAFSAFASEEWTLQNVADNPADWREVAPENLVLMKTTKGDILIEMAPQFAPRHTERIREILHGGLYDGTKFHRVINGFMAQGGDISAIRPDFELPPLSGEFVFRRDPEQMKLTPLDPDIADDPYYAGYIDGFPVATSQKRLADYTMDHRVESWMPHCQGVVSMARTNDPNSAMDQFFLMRDETPSLDRKYTAWGRMLSGVEAARAMNIGEPPQQPDIVVTARLVSDMPETLRPRAFVLRNESAAFQALIADAKDAQTVCQAPQTPAVVEFP